MSKVPHVPQSDRRVSAHYTAMRQREGEQPYLCEPPGLFLLQGKGAQYLLRFLVDTLTSMRLSILLRSNENPMR